MYFPILRWLKDIQLLEYWNSLSVSLGFPGMIYGSGCLKLTTIGFADLTDVTLADAELNTS